MPEPIAIAIDGPVASGKTVVGKLVAKRLGLRFLDTGWMYRAVAFAALRRGIDPRDEEALVDLARGLAMRLAPAEGSERLIVDGHDVTERLREPDVERDVSPVAKVSGVRSALVAQQRAIAREGPIVMAGRDIGAVVLPDAAVKVYLTASVGLRAQRRYAELQCRAESVEYAQVMNDLIRRDKIDAERADSPLRPAPDAVLIDTENMGVEELAQRIVCLVGRK